jgi:predicted lipoprotein with Yx(FWY)xxD motif
MTKVRAFAMFAAGLALASLILAGCGATSGSGGGLYGNGGNTSAAPTNTPASGGGAASIGTATATVNGQSVTILTNSSGKTLYYYKPDTATTSACTGGCASAWPPVLSPGGTPSSLANLPGKLAVINDANGMQVTYNGHPLYTFANDSAPGMTTGEGVNNFFVATPSLALQSSTGGNAAPTATTRAGYGY